MKLIARSVIKFPNGMVAVCGEDGQQIPELQGKYSPELLKRIEACADELTEWLGFSGGIDITPIDPTKYQHLSDAFDMVLRDLIRLNLIDLSKTTIKPGQ